MTFGDFIFLFKASLSPPQAFAYEFFSLPYFAPSPTILPLDNYTEVGGIPPFFREIPETTLRSFPEGRFSEGL